MQCDRVAVLSVARAYTLMKDLVDSPAISLGPAELEAAAFAIGRKVSDLIVVTYVLKCILN